MRDFQGIIRFALVSAFLAVPASAIICYFPVPESYRSIFAMVIPIIGVYSAGHLRGFSLHKIGFLHGIRSGITCFFLMLAITLVIFHKLPWSGCMGLITALIIFMVAGALGSVVGQAKYRRGRAARKSSSYNAH